MHEISVYITAGIGSEKHNHNLGYRATLPHTHDDPDGVIEYVDYIPYDQAINDIMRPYIDAHNQDVDQRYQDAVKQYELGLRKTKPRQKDYKRMGYDYYNDHLQDKVRNPRTGKVEAKPLWRSYIIGIGDMEDRTKNRITREQAKSIFGEISKMLTKDFHWFCWLGHSLHLDEEGNYHMHVDYVPIHIRDNPGNRFPVTISFDSALKDMGYEPEHSFIYKTDGRPSRFNAARNHMYRSIEQILLQHGLHLMYGASQIKDPDKDPSTHYPLEEWQARQKEKELHNDKHCVLDIVMCDYVSPGCYKQAVSAAYEVEEAAATIMASPKGWLGNNYLVSCNSLDHFVEKLKSLKGQLGHLIRAQVRLDERDKSEREHLNEIAQLQQKVHELSEDKLELYLLIEEEKEKAAKKAKEEEQKFISNWCNRRTRERYYTNRYDENGRPYTVLELIFQIAIIVLTSERNYPKFSDNGKPYVVDLGQIDWKVQEMVDAIHIVNEEGLSTPKEIEFRIRDARRLYGQLKRELSDKERIVKTLEPLRKAVGICEEYCWINQRLAAMDDPDEMEALKAKHEDVFSAYASAYNVMSTYNITTEEQMFDFWWWYDGVAKSIPTLQAELEDARKQHQKMKKLERQLANAQDYKYCYGPDYPAEEAFEGVFGPQRFLRNDGSKEK